MERYSEYKSRYGIAKGLALKDTEEGLKLFNDLISDINSATEKDGVKAPPKKLLIKCVKAYCFLWYQKRAGSTNKKDRKPRFLRAHLDELTNNNIQPDLLKEIVQQVASKHHNSTKRSLDLKKLISELKNEEGSQVEVKKSLQLREPIGKTISSFANTKGGKVYVGIAEIKNEPNGSEGIVINDIFLVVGLYRDIDQHRANLTSHLDKSLSINLEKLDFRIEDINDKRIMVITVPAICKDTGEITSYENEVYQRIDNHNKKLTGIEVYQLTSQVSKNKTKAANDRKPASIQLKSKLIWATNYSGFGAGFNCELSIDNYGRSDDYITEIKLMGFDDKANRWETRHFKIDRLRIDDELEVGKNKIISAGVFISDDLTEGRLTPNLDKDRLELVIMFRSGDQVTIKLKPTQIQGTAARQ